MIAFQRWEFLRKSESFVVFKRSFCIKVTLDALPKSWLVIFFLALNLQQLLLQRFHRSQSFERSFCVWGLWSLWSLNWLGLRWCACSTQTLRCSTRILHQYATSGICVITDYFQFLRKLFLLIFLVFGFFQSFFSILLLKYSILQ